MDRVCSHLPWDVPCLVTDAPLPDKRVRLMEGIYVGVVWVDKSTLVPLGVLGAVMLWPVTQQREVT